MPEESEEQELVFNAGMEVDDRGCHLQIETDEDNYSFLIQDTATARTMLAATSKLRPWIDERDRESAVAAATEDERLHDETSTEGGTA